MFAAKCEFAARGFDGARMESIAKEAGVNKAMLHYYFDNKERLYKEVLIFLVGRTPKHELFSVVLNERLAPPETLAYLLYFMIRVHLELIDPDFHRMLNWDIAEGRKNLKFLFSNYFAPGMEKLSLVIREGVEEGSLQTRYPFFVVWHFTSFLVNYVSQRKLFEGTSVYKKLHPKNGEEVVFDYLLQSVFQILRPAGKELPTPKIEGALKSKLDEIIDTIKSKKKNSG